MAKASIAPTPHVLSYETRSQERDWGLVASRLLHLAGFVVWVVVGVSFYNLYTDLSDSPAPLWFDAGAGAVTGGIIASPIFGTALLMRRFGRRITSRCSRPPVRGGRRRGERGLCDSNAALPPSRESFAIRTANYRACICKGTMPWPRRMLIGMAR